MDEYNNKGYENESEEKGTISGFDNETEPSFADSYYSLPHNEIINDDPIEKTYDAPYASEVNNRSVEKEKKSHSTATVIVSAVLAAVIGVVSTIGVLSFSRRINLYKSSNLPSVSTEKNSAGKSNVNITVDENVSSIATAVAAKCSDNVVGIMTTTSVTSFFGGTSEATGSGSGVIYTQDGYIITNYHVIENVVTSYSQSSISVYVGNAKTTPYPAEIVGYNIACDLAVLKINASGLPAAEIGNSDNLKVGQYAVTIGAPGGLEFMGSVTYGIISGLDRVVSSNSAVGLIQTDAAINPGNSGGALLDESGKLIGVNSSKIVSEEFEGMGFAIPVNTVVEICNKIIANKDNKEPYVGITVSSKYTADVLKSYGYPAGAVVRSVDPDSPADACGINKGDIITSFNGTDITEYDVFEKELSKTKPGKTVDISVYRNGKIYKTEIKIGSNS